jgi:hypothetical protein
MSFLVAAKRGKVDTDPIWDVAELPTWKFPAIGALVSVVGKSHCRYELVIWL